MSKRINKKFLIALMFMLVSLFFFGCGKSSSAIKVKNIYFNFESGEHIALMVGEKLDLSNYVLVVPDNATNKEYSISSLNEQVVSVEGKTIKAVSAGYAIIKVTAEDDGIKESSIIVVVKQEKETLAQPENLRYDSATQTIMFDAVDFASSYTLKIDGEEIELGTFTSYSLKNSPKQKLDQVLNIQVRANAPDYSEAFNSSEFTSGYKIYQSSAVNNFKIENGVGSFGDISENSKVQVFINDEILVNDLMTHSFDLTNLNEKYAGAEVKVSVVTGVKEQSKELIGADVYGLGVASIDVKVLDLCKLSLNDNTLTWTNEGVVNKFELFVGSEKIADCTTNSYDLSKMANFGEKFNKGTEVELKPVLDGSVNVAKTAKTGKAKIQRLSQPEITFNKSKVEWSTVEYADSYSVEIVNVLTGVKLDSYVFSNSLDMQNYDSGDYSIIVKAVSNGELRENGICYLSSQPSSTTTFKKHQQVTVEIENATLKIGDEGTGTYLVEFNDGENNFITSEKSVDLKELTFKAGINSVKVTKLGENTNIDGDCSEEYFFTQLEELKSEDVVIQNDTISVAKSEINKNATIELVVYKVEGQTETELFSVKNDSYQFNSTDEGVDHLLSAGKYVVKIYVLGDGKNTLSVRDSQGDNKVSLEKGFEVLSCASVNIENTSEKVLLLNEVEHALSYVVYDANSNELYNGAVNQYNFADYDFLVDGDLKLFVQALGDGEYYLDSIKSDEIVISQLVKPEIKFSSVANVISKQDINSDNVKEWIFKINDEVVAEYDFTSAYEFDDDVDVFNLSLTAVAKQGSNNKFYIDSIASEKTITRIANEINVSLSGIENNLIIEHLNYNQEFDINLNIICGGQKYTLSSVGKERILTNGSTELNYAYSNGRYIVELMKNNQPIISGMEETFDVEIQFLNVSDGDDEFINSNLKECVGLQLIKVENQTVMELNSDGELEITNNAYSERMKVVLEVNGKEYIENAQGTHVVNGGVELPIVFVNETYYIDLLNDEYEPLSSDFESAFSVKVKYCQEIESDGFADTDFSDEFMFEIEYGSSFSRSEQSLIIYNVKPTYGVANYKLLINGNVYDMSGVASINNDGDIVIDADFIFNKVVNATDVTTVEVLTIGNATSLTKKGASVQIKQAAAPSFISTKDNDNANNSAVITLHTENNFTAQYVVECYEGNTLKTTENYYYDNSVGGTYNINVDEKTNGFSGNLKFKAYILTEGKESDVEVFNSLYTEIEYAKIKKVSGISIANNILTFNAVDNAVGYEIYVDGIKFNTSLVKNVRYDLGLIDSVCNLQVKAISEEDGFTNSDLTTEITVSPLQNPTIEFIDGVAIVHIDGDLGLILSQNNIIPRITDSRGNSILDIVNINNVDEGVVVDIFKGKIKIQPYVFMNYNSTPMSAETIDFQLVVDSFNGEYYLNSSKMTFNLYGMYAPINVKKSTSESNNSVEFVSWEANPANKINGTTISEKYIMKIVKDGQSYYSNDTKLKYKMGANTYSNYGAFITETSVNFPCFYDKNDNGIIDDSDVVFDSGNYEVYVQAVPASSVAGITICGSEFSEACEFEIMNNVTLSVDRGKVSWTPNLSATKYEIKVYKNDILFAEQVNVVTDEDSGNVYEFSAESLIQDNHETDLESLSGVYKVAVKAISTREDVLNSKESEIYVYRLNPAVSVSVDDGCLLLTANKYVSQINLEFENKDGLVYDCSVVNSKAERNLAELNISSWEELTSSLGDVSIFQISVDKRLLALLSGDYWINVTLQGNSNSKLGLITSPKVEKISNVTASKLAVNSFEVKKGVIKFEANSQYATYTKQDEEVIYSQSIDLNYNFGGTVNYSDFWNNTIIYKINVNDSHEIYAVDYYSLCAGVKNGLISDNDGKFAEFMETNAVGAYHFINYNENIKFNIFKNNEINFRDLSSIIYYTESEQFLNLTTGGNYNVKIYMLGGDSFEKEGKLVGALTAETPIIHQLHRYKDTSFTIVDGKLAIQKQSLIDGDAPVYRLKINKDGTNDYIYYLYTGEKTNAEQSVASYDGDLSSPNIAQKYYQLTEYDESTNNYYFDMSNVFTSGVFNIDVTILVGGQEVRTAEDYFLNSLTSAAVPVFKIADCEASIVDGEISFDKASIIVDGKIEYLNNVNYEITITKDGVDYTFNVDSNSPGIRFGADNKVYYNLPQYVSDLEVESGEYYAMRVRALPKSNAYSNILNGTYAIDSTNGQYKILEFSRLREVSDVQINNGKIEWKTNSEATRFGVLISFKDEYNSPKQIFIAEGIVVEDGKAFLSISDEQYPLNGEVGKLAILSKYTNGTMIDYSIEVYAISDSPNLMNSFSVKGEKFNRLPSVDADSIRTEDGVLKWDSITDADVYQVVVEDSNKVKFTFEVEGNEFDLSDKELPVGNYVIFVKALGSSMVSAIDTKSEKTFIQLGVVDEKTVQIITAPADIEHINSGIVKWDAVENCSIYLVTVKYNQDSVYTDIVDETEMLIPVEIDGEFVIEIVALTNAENTAFKSKISSYLGSTESPEKVRSAVYDEETQEFVVDAKLLTSDKILISFNFAQYQAGGIIGGGKATLEMDYNESQEYRIKLTKMGKYTNVMVKVVRGNSSSEIVNIQDVDLKLFAYGEGTKENPYTITNSTHLLNMKYYNDNGVYFKLGGNINMAGVVQSWLLSEELKNGVILDEFKGVLDGGGFAIYEFNYDVQNLRDVITFNGQSSFALFGKLNGARIENLVIGKENIPLNITNTFSGVDGEVLESDLTFAMLAISSENSIISNIAVKNVYLQLNGNVKLKGNLNIAGLIVNSKNDTIQDCSMGFDIELNIDFANTASYASNIAGFVDKTEGGLYNNLEVVFRIVDNRTNNPMVLNNIAGVLANASNVELMDITANVKVIKTKCLNFGGVVAYANAINLRGCDVVVVFGGESDSDKYRVDLETVYYGGVIGYAINNCKIGESDRSVDVTFNIIFSTGKYVDNLIGFERVS